MSSRFGEILRVSIFGESHGEAVGVLVEGLPAGEEIDIGRLEAFMARRTPGGELSTARREPDIPHIVSGLLNGRTTGTPLCAVIENRDARPGDYSRLRDTPRPGHADYPALARYGAGADLRGGGHFSGRLTAPLCAAGAICLQLLERRGVTVGAHIHSIGGAADTPLDPVAVTAEQLAGIGKRPLPVLDAKAGERMRAEILAAARAGDSVGGTVECCALGLPPGLGGPLFGGMESRLAAVLFGIPAVKGIEFGAGFSVSEMRGSENNDAYCWKDGRVQTETNRHGGVLGGLTTGMPLLLRAAFKPTPSIGLEQKTVRLTDGTDTVLRISGRHDPCIVPRAVPCVEAATAAVLLDCMLQYACGKFA